MRRPNVGPMTTRRRRADVGLIIILQYPVARPLFLVLIALLYIKFCTHVPLISLYRVLQTVANSLLYKTNMIF